ncbi:hypothetical protein D3C87_320750 [compost metagenome]
MKRMILACALVMSFLFAGVLTARTIEPISQALLQPQAGAEPLLVLVEYDPWAMVIGSDTPKFVLYDDGVVIYRKDDGHHTARLSPDEMATFRASLRPEALSRLAGSYALTENTDQPTTDILLRSGSTYARISIYGSLSSLTVGPALPTEILDTYERLIAFERRDAVPWRPEKVEVMIWPYEYAPDESIIWPAGWPGITHVDTQQRGENYSLYISASEYLKLREFLGTRRSRGAVLIDGRKWAAQVRLPFPKEDRWMGAGED